MNKICRINKSIIIKIYCLKNYCFFYWNNLTRLDCKNTLKNYSECMLSYGENCQHHCNIHCINQTCDRVNGSCLFGCIYGKQCRKGMFLYFRYFPKMSCCPLSLRLSVRPTVFPSACSSVCKRFTYFTSSWLKPVNLIRIHFVFLLHVLRVNKHKYQYNQIVAYFGQLSSL